MQTIDAMGTIFFLDQLPTVTTDRVRSALEISGLDPEMARDLSKRYCFTRSKNQMKDEGLIDEVGESPLQLITGFQPGSQADKLICVDRNRLCGDKRFVVIKHQVVTCADGYPPYFAVQFYCFQQKRCKPLDIDENGLIYWSDNAHYTEGACKI